MQIQTFKSVFDALITDPAERANLKLRAELMSNIKKIITENGWTENEAAQHCQINPTRMKEFLMGKIEKFSLDTLVNMNTCLGQAVSLHFDEA